MLEMKRVLYDTYNISLPTGTGIATYAKALVKIAPSIGYEPELLYEFKGKIPKNLELAKAILFEDRVSKTSSYQHALNTVKACVPGLNTARAVCLPERSFLYEDPIRNRMTNARQRWISREIFLRAQCYFSVHGKLFPTTLASTPDLAHFTFQLPVRVSDAPNIYTIHDLVPLIVPYATLDNRKRTFRLLKKIGETADHIVTVSEQSRRDIVKVLGVPENRVTNTYQAVTIPEHALIKTPDEVEDEISGLYGLSTRNYYLFYGAIEPKKNVRRLIEGYLSSRVKRPLVIVSSGGWKNKAELQMIEDHPVRPDGSGIIKLGYLPYEFLISLIKGARAVLFPSIYEGFGLPALEAMILGTPVLTANSSSLVEVAGDAAVCVNPIDIMSIRSGILSLDADEVFLDELSRKGLEQAALFSIDNYKERLSDLYGSLC